MTDLEAVEHPDVKPGICGHTRTIGRFEWICVREPHENVYRRRRRSRHGEPYTTEQPQYPPRPGESVQGDRHWFVNRWPNRNV